jgi:hypothetical protein
MRIKLVVLDLELSRGAKRIAAAVAIALLAVGAGAIAYASVPHAWRDGDALTADDLNGNFAALDGRITTLEQPGPRSAVLAHKTTAQTVAANTGSVLTFGSESFDVNNEFDPATGSFTAKREGYYHIDCAALFNGTDTGCITLYIFQDGNSVAETISCGPLQAHSVTVSAVVHVAAAGALSCQLFNALATNETVGGSLPIDVARNYIAISSVQ